MIVVDASAVLELLLRTASGTRVEERVFASEEVLIAPHLLDVEITQALRRLVQLKAITPARGRHALDDHAALLIKRMSHEPLLSRMWELRETVTAYDASYVALAEALDTPLLTCDTRLARAQGHRATIELVEQAGR